jgi:hypothetical protein
VLRASLLLPVRFQFLQEHLLVEPVKECALKIQSMLDVLGAS